MKIFHLIILLLTAAFSFQALRCVGSDKSVYAYDVRTEQSVFQGVQFDELLSKYDGS